MSVAMISRVWKHSSQSGGPLLVLLAIADYADDHGRAYPSVPALMAKARLSERSVQYALRRLASSAELHVATQAGPHGCNLYQILVAEPPPSDTADFAPRRNDTPQNTTSRGAKRDIEGCNGLHPNRHKNRHRTVTGPARARAREEEPTNRPTDPVSSNQGDEGSDRVELPCPLAPHTFVGSYSDHLNDPRHRMGGEP